MGRAEVNQPMCWAIHTEEITFVCTEPDGHPGNHRETHVEEDGEETWREWSDNGDGDNGQS